jgi:transposase
VKKSKQNRYRIAISYMRKQETKQRKGEPKGEPARVKTINRWQMILRATDVEGLVEYDHPVRAVWEMVGQLDLTGYRQGIASVEGSAGRPAMDPQLMISLWIYAYSEGVSSAREISRLCEYHPAYQWLTGLEPVNYHTLSDFRVGHQAALRDLFVQVLGVLSSQGLVTLQRVMHDGTKIKACASGKSFRREKRIREHLELARKQVKALEELSEEEMSARIVKARQRAAKEKQERLELALKELEKIRVAKQGEEAKKEARVSTSDPEARIMKQSDGGYAPNYNVQISTDAKAGIIVGLGVIPSPSDQGQLVAAVERIEENMNDQPKQMVIDGGFSTGETIAAMSEKGIDLIGVFPEEQDETAGRFEQRGIATQYRPAAFVYDATGNCYTCPVGKVLSYQGKQERCGRIRYIYQASNCLGCPHQKECCPMAKKGRSIIRTELSPAVAAFKSKMQTEEAKQIYRQRAPIAEFSNAWLKSKIGLRQFRLRGMCKVTCEAMWACLTYNIQQWLRLRWRQQVALAVV